jgi:hypothetical protein
MIFRGERLRSFPLFCVKGENMAGNQITFVPEDFDSVLTLKDLISHITTIITEIRNNDNIGKETRNSIEELKNIA